MTGTDNDKLNYKDGFSELFVKFIDAMVDYEHFSRDALVDALSRLARSFRLTKVVTEFYKSMIAEKDGEGEILAFHDNNGYPNFAYYSRHLGKMSKTGGFLGFTAAMYNLKDFSGINRDIGFESGNVVMKAHYETLRDMIGERGTVCRVVGDNFAAIFPNELLEQIITFLEGTPVIYDQETKGSVSVSACAGIFVIPEDFVYERPGNIVDMIMPTCQAAKVSAETDFVYASMKNLEDKENAKRVRRDFVKALKNSEFQAYYQPKVNVETGRITGAEALCRWIRDGKMITPMEFIPILERSTDIFRLDFYMLDLVCKNIRKWLDEGRNAVRISINISRKHLTDPKLLDNIVDIVNRYDIPYEYIEIELTETTTEGDYNKLKKLVEGLKKIGIYTAIDDFGIGYSSLNLIRELPWNVMKIDRSLLPTSSTNEKDLSTILYKHITAMACDMGLECITEGVETEEQVQILRDNSCEYAQGYYYDRPLPLDEFEKRLEAGEYPVHLR